MQRHPRETSAGTCGDFLFVEMVPRGIDVVDKEVQMLAK